MWAQQKLEILYSATNRDWTRNALKMNTQKLREKKTINSVKMPKISVTWLKISTSEKCAPTSIQNLHSLHAYDDMTIDLK